MASKDKNTSSKNIRKVSRHVLSIDEPQYEQENTHNAFQISRVEQTENKPNKKKGKVQIKNRVQSSQQILFSPQTQKKAQQRIELQNIQNKRNRMDVQEHEEVEVVGVSQKSWLTLSQSINLSFGHFNYKYKFPIKREIPIIANNLDLERQKYQNGTYISQSFDNNLQVSFLLFFIRTVLYENFFRVSFLLWLIAIVLGFLVPSNEQYRPGRQIILAIFIFYCVVTFILQYFTLRNRRTWTQPSSDMKYKVYHYDNQTRSAEWIQTDATDLRPGNIYMTHAATPSKASVIPVDSILLHGPRTIVQIDQSPIIEYLSPKQKQENISLKQILLKSKSIKLPFTGAIHYQLAGPEIIEDNIYGKFILLEPTVQTHDVHYTNVILRGSRLISSQIFFKDQFEQKNEKNEQYYAMVLQTGIDSLNLKTSQYPYLFRQAYTFSKVIDMVLIVCSILYVLVLGSGILIGYIYLEGKSIARGYFIQNYLDLGQQPTKLATIVLNHFANLIMIIPLLLRVIYLTFIFISGIRFNNKINVSLKDMHMLAEAAEADVLVTTIGSDLSKMNNNSLVQNQLRQQRMEQQNLAGGKNRSLQSIRVGKIHHNFLTTSIQNDMYKQNDVQLIRFFMGTSILTCNFKNPTPLERGIIERCKQLQLKIQRNGNIISIQNSLKVLKVFTIPATERYPFKIQFFRDSDHIIKDYEQQQKLNSKQKIIVIVRGETSKLTSGLPQSQSRLLKDFSSKLHQEKGYHIELLGRFTIQFQQFKEIKRIYASNQKQRTDNAVDVANSRLGITKFYLEFDKYLRKIDAMGLLIWENPYNVLSNNILPISSLKQIGYKIIIAPPSKSLVNPQFESIHAITNYLLKAQKLPLKQISNKILHHYTDKQTIWALLQTEKILVLNGWDYQVIQKMLTQLKQIKISGRRNVKMLGYIQQDEYAWVLKQTDVSISTQGDGYDLQKYADIVINQGSSQTITKIIRSIILYSRAYSYGISGIILIQFMKAVILAVIQFINLFYTWGTGLVVIGSPLYLLLEFGLLLDAFYYIFPFIKDYQTKPKDKKQQNKKMEEYENENTNIKQYLTLQYMIRQLIMNLLIGVFIALIPIYSLVEPIAQNGVTQPKQFTHAAIHFILYHVLIFRKLFMRPFALSVFKLFIILVQIGIFYLGFVIISGVDYYNYKGIIWYLISGKLILVSIFVVWIITSIYWIIYMIETMMKDKLKPVKNKYQKINEDKKEDQSINEGQKIKVMDLQND